MSISTASKGKEVFINRFGVRKNATEGNREYRLGEIVISASYGICMIQAFCYDERYWVETGEWTRCGYVNDVAKKVNKSERAVFLKAYRKSYKERLLDRFWPKDNEHRDEAKKHLIQIDSLLKL